MKLREALEASRWVGVVVFVLFVLFTGIIGYFVVQNMIGIVVNFAVVLGAFLVLVLTTGYAENLGKRTRQATSEELRREDDVLLQAVALSQGTLFIYLNVIQVSDIVTALKVLVPILAVSFYALRAYGKIRDDGKYRYRSIWLFFFILLMLLGYSTTAGIQYFLGQMIASSWYYFVGSFYGSVVVALMGIIGNKFKKRYGLA